MRWLGWTLGAAFALAIGLPVMGILSSRQTAGIQAIKSTLFVRMSKISSGG
jgi:hypothetical protein